MPETEALNIVPALQSLADPTVSVKYVKLGLEPADHAEILDSDLEVIVKLGTVPALHAVILEGDLEVTVKLGKVP